MPDVAALGRAGALVGAILAGIVATTSLKVADTAPARGGRPVRVLLYALAFASVVAILAAISSISRGT